MVPTLSRRSKHEPTEQQRRDDPVRELRKLQASIALPTRQCLKTTENLSATATGIERRRRPGLAFQADARATVLYQALTKGADFTLTASNGTSSRRSRSATSTASASARLKVTASKLKVAPTATSVGRSMSAGPPAKIVTHHMAPRKANRRPRRVRQLMRAVGESPLQPPRKRRQARALSGGTARANVYRRFTIAFAHYGVRWAQISAARPLIWPASF